VPHQVRLAFHLGAVKALTDEVREELRALVNGAAEVVSSGSNDVSTEAVTDGEAALTQ
jgi:hypothetical protein